eukprot:gnl/TRDRNA2_/TRDRNA2_184502_c0_seq1.p1 gnl/TRDRNA2_/TRDRNA2_184502_c0~~gnl/TRDRNA2_/TRDRNA2_184502_c0_seq1.p1  ORF type:complete len:476 (+),score=105.94 gnl/TRDRNA2_/TRDRNA2_184502_c0_seq1:131-1558(+)
MTNRASLALAKFEDGAKKVGGKALDKVGDAAKRRQSVAEMQANVGALVMSGAEHRSQHEANTAEDLGFGQSAKNKKKEARDRAEAERRRREEERAEEERKRTQHRKAERALWRENHFHIGAQLKSAAPNLGPDVPRTESLAEWLDACSFTGFAGSGNIFGAAELPRGYTAVYDERGLPWIWHGRSAVLLWPVRIDIGHASVRADFATLFYYTSAAIMKSITKTIITGSTQTAIFKAIIADASHRGSQDHGVVLTSLEPGCWNRNRDILRDIFGFKIELHGEHFKAATHCLPLALPWTLLNADSNHERTDRLHVDAPKLFDHLGTHAAQRGHGSHVMSAGNADLAAFKAQQSSRLKCPCRRRSEATEAWMAEHMEFHHKLERLRKKATEACETHRETPLRITDSPSPRTEGHHKQEWLRHLAAQKKAEKKAAKRRQEELEAGEAEYDEEGEEEEAHEDEEEEEAEEDEEEAADNKV